MSRTHSRQLADELAPVLDELDRDGWTVHDDDDDGMVSVVSPDGIPFVVRDHRDQCYGSPRANEVGKAHVAPHAPAGLDDHWRSRGRPRDQKRPEMNASVDRGAQAIAKDLVRKLLPEALQLLADAQVNKCETEEAEQWEAATLGDVAAALGVPAPERPDDRYGRRQWRAKFSARPRVERSGPGFRRVEVETSTYSRSVTLNIADVPADVAVKIAALLAESEPWSTW